METVTISVKITTGQRAKMRQLGIKPTEVLKTAVDKEIRRREIERAVKRASKLMKDIDLPIDRVVASIREDRDSR